ncbi:MAG: FAD-dependent oxidoreductase [Streptosporangiales bacterium]|nr:FAD-dependent oxidoreductase [Streptosporangiales bacterium]
MTNTTEQYDVVVVGAGIAGLASALSAHEAGARVAVLERAPAEESGGNTRYTEAYLRMKSEDEVSADFEDSLLGDFMGYPDPGLTEELVRDRSSWPSNLKAMHILDPEVVGTFAQSAGPTLGWLRGFGVEFGPTTTGFITTSTTRLAPVGGGLALVETLTEAATDRGVDFHFRTSARGLLRGDDGAVTGVTAVRADGEPVDFTGRVVLACGGFEGNAEMQARYFGGRALVCRPIARGGYYNKGEGIEMALAAGASSAGNYSLFHAEPQDPRSSQAEPAIFVFPYGILVNLHGERFVDEAPGPADATYEAVTRVINEQPRGIGYVLLDGKIDDVPTWQRAVRTDRPAIEGDTLEALAEQLEIPAETLRATVAAYNRACPDAGSFDPLRTDGLATTDLQPEKSNWARPIDTAPYRAYPITAANVFTFGGLKVDPQAQVVDRDGTAIRGLYAAGEIIGSYYTRYTGSTSVLKGAVFGRIAGAEAAKR